MGDPVSIEVDSPTIESAIQIARYLIPHAEAVLTMARANDQTPVDDARYLLRWIIRRDRREFTKRDAHQDCKRRFRKTDDIEPALAELERRGYVAKRLVTAKGPGRLPSPVYDVTGWR